jgi:hypothetical protein
MLVLHFGIAVSLGFADIVNTYTVDSIGEKRSYQAVFWFEVGCAAAALVIMVFFVKIKKAESELTVDERAELGEAMAGVTVRTSANRRERRDVNHS